MAHRLLDRAAESAGARGLHSRTETTPTHGATRPMNHHQPQDKTSSVATHPLDPLSAAEIARAASVIAEHYQWGADLRVETIDIVEPPKDEVRSFQPGTPFARIARYNAFKRGQLGVWQGRVDLASGKIVAEKFDEAARAMVAIEEVFEIFRALC